jgi:hypothetical protein
VVAAIDINKSKPAEIDAVKRSKKLQADRSRRKHHFRRDPICNKKDGHLASHTIIASNGP